MFFVGQSFSFSNCSLIFKFMKVNIGVTWEGLSRPTLARSLLASLAPQAREAIIFLNTVWLPPYSREAFSLADHAKTCGIEAPSLPKLSMLEPGPTTPPAAFVPAASLKALASDLASLLNEARDKAQSDPRIAKNLLLLVGFDGLGVRDQELVALMGQGPADPLTSLADELRLAHAKHLVTRLMEPSSSLYQITYGPYIFLRDDSPTLWGASRLVDKPSSVTKKDLEAFMASRARRGEALPWGPQEAMVDPAELGQITKVEASALQWTPFHPSKSVKRPSALGPLTGCFVEENGVRLSLGLARLRPARGQSSSSHRLSLSDAQNLNMAERGDLVVSDEMLRYWRHTILRAYLDKASKARDQRVYLLVLSSMKPEDLLKALRHYASSLAKAKSSVQDLVMVALDRATLEKFAKAMKCSLEDKFFDIFIDQNLALNLNHQAKAFTK